MGAASQPALDTPESWPADTAGRNVSTIAPSSGAVAAHASAARRPRLLHLLWITVLVIATLAVVFVGGHGRSLEIDTDQRTIIDRLESVLIHDTVVPQYGRVVNQFDERGYVAGIGDFSTAGGQALDVVQTYTARIGSNALG